MDFPVPLSGQPSTVQFRGGQSTVQQHGFPGNQKHFGSHDRSYNNLLALFTINKPLDAKSWDDATRVYHPLSSSDIQKALAKLQQDPRKSVKDTLTNLKSGSAQRAISALVQEQNDKLRGLDPASEWKVAGIQVKKQLVTHWVSQKEIIKSIDVILRTEPAAFHTQDLDDDDDDLFGPPPQRGSFETSGTHQAFGIPQRPHANMMHADPQGMHAPPPKGNLSMQGHIHERDPMPARNDFPPPPNNFNPGPPGGSHAQGGAHQDFKPQGGPHPGPNGHGGPPSGQQPPRPPLGPKHPEGGPQSVVMMPPPPPDVPNGAIKHTQVVQPPFDPQQPPPRPMPGSFPGPMPGPQFAPPEVLDPYVLKHKRSKPKSLRREYLVISEPETESDSEYSTDGSRFSVHSRGSVGIIERSRSRGRRMSKARSPSRGVFKSRSSDRNRMPKVHKMKKSHAPSQPDIEIVHEGRQKSSSKESSPRSSASGLPTQPIINIHNHNDNDRALGRSHNREQKSERGREMHTSGQDPRRYNDTIPPPSFSNPVYPMHDKFNALPMSRNTSVGGSDSESSLLGSTYTSDDSVFSEPVRPTMHGQTTSEAGAGLHLHSRALPIPRVENFASAYHESRHRQKPHFQADDYPRVHDRKRGSLYREYTEPSHVPSYQRPSMPPRRHSVQIPNPFYPDFPTPSRSYDEVPRPYAYNPQPQQQRYIAESRPEAFDLYEMKARLEAIEHMNQSRRLGMPSRRNSLRGRMGPDVDQWAYQPQYDRLYDGFRHV